MRAGLDSCDAECEKFGFGINILFLYNLEQFMRMVSAANVVSSFGVGLCIMALFSPFRIQLQRGVADKEQQELAS